jgi:hypothetical protein
LAVPLPLFPASPFLAHPTRWVGAGRLRRHVVRSRPVAQDPLRGKTWAKMTSMLTACPPSEPPSPLGGQLRPLPHRESHSRGVALAEQPGSIRIRIGGSRAIVRRFFAAVRSVTDQNTLRVRRFSTYRPAVCDVV